MAQQKLPRECVAPKYKHQWVKEGKVHLTIMGRIQIFRCSRCKALGSGAPDATYAKLGRG